MVADESEDQTIRSRDSLSAEMAQLAAHNVGRERRERLSQLGWCGEGCFDSRRRVNSDVMPLVHQENIARVYRAGFAWTILCLVVIFRRAVMTDPSTGV